MVSGEHRRRLGRAEKGVRWSNNLYSGQEAFVGVVVGLRQGLHGHQGDAEGENSCGLVQLPVGNVGGYVADVHHAMQGVESGVGRTAESTETERSGSD